MRIEKYFNKFLGVHSGAFEYSGLLPFDATSSGKSFPSFPTNIPLLASRVEVEGSTFLLNTVAKDLSCTVASTDKRPEFSNYNRRHEHLKYPGINSNLL